MPESSVKRILTGMRPTGDLHLGHKVGALDLWKAAQNNVGIEQFYLVADMQALTTHLEELQKVKSSVRTIVLDWMSVGLDPRNSHVHFVLQSQVRARGMISHYLMMQTPFNALEANPTIKTERANLEKQGKSVTAGFMVYPVDQSADILMVSPENLDGNQLLVPVGADQIPHLEDARDAARKFNKAHGVELLMACEPQVSEVPRLVGTDGDGKMGKSTNNAIFLSDSPSVVRDKVMGMFTDPNHIRLTDAGDVENNPVFIYLRAFSKDREMVRGLEEDYKKPGVPLGDVAVKNVLIQCINEMLGPIRERRLAAENEPVGDFLRHGTQRASEIADEVLVKMENAMSVGYPD